MDYSGSNNYVSTSEDQIVAVSGEAIVAARQVLNHTIRGEVQKKEGKSGCMGVTHWCEGLNRVAKKQAKVSVTGLLHDQEKEQTRQNMQQSVQGFVLQ